MAAGLAALALTLVTSTAHAGEHAPPPMPAAYDSGSTVSTAFASSVQFPAPRVRAWQTGLVRPDRLEHAGLSFTLVAALTIATHNPAAAASTSLALGVAKELWDARTPSGADALDLTADACGVALALWTVGARTH
jgi:hypothetical protein